MALLSDLKRMSPTELSAMARNHEMPGLKHRDRALIFAAELRDISKEKLVTHADQLRESGNFVMADTVLSGARHESKMAYEDRRIARRVRIRESAARKGQRVYA